MGKPLYSREFHLWHRRLTRALATSIFTPFQPASAKHFGVQSTSHFSDLTPGGLTLALYNEKVIDHYQNPRNVGEIDAWCVLIETLCASLGIACFGLAPSAKAGSAHGAKIDAATFSRLTGWAGRSNQHQRDAAMIAWSFRRVRP